MITTTGQDDPSAREVDALVDAVKALRPLPRLSSQEHRAASDQIQALLDSVTHRQVSRLGADGLCETASHLREIGDPSAAETLALRGVDRLLEQGHVTDAVMLLNQAGLACFDQGALADAEHHFTKALSLIPSPDLRLQTPVLLVNQATVLTEMGNYEQALLLYERTLRELEGAATGSYGQRDGLLPQQARGLVTNNIGWVLLRSARAAGNDRDLIARAMMVFDTALALPLNTRTRLIAVGNRAEASLMKGDMAAAESSLENAEQECLNAGYQRLLPEMYRRRAQLCAALGDGEAAIDWARTAMDASIAEANPRQELRIVEVFLDILRGVTAYSTDPVAALESTGLSVVTQILAVLESKDTYTGGSHSRRVADLAHRISTRLVGDGPGQQRWCKRVELGGLFHDVGKLRLPWSLLNRVSALSARDWQLLKAHTSLGETMLRDCGLWSLALVAGGHHERPDGRGYPRGDTRATLESAVVAAADAFDAMTSSSRVHTRPKTPMDAMEVVRAGSGTQFRPDVVVALEAALSQA
ncbi:tetratricopeptide repeat protein [Candidatus Fermentibacteria bacterium]|nr:tetratricopeptide repeat protein [Candidatus Fermentibacteria bacterium]